jgi:hypothetical protein
MAVALKTNETYFNLRNETDSGKSLYGVLKKFVS